MGLSDWLITKIDITRELIEMKLVLGLFESCYGPLSKDISYMYIFFCFKFFWIFGHVTNDVIIWSRDQIWEIFLDQNFRKYNLGKVSKYQSERGSRFLYMN